jgi:hypothetical protein
MAQSVSTTPVISTPAKATYINVRVNENPRRAAGMGRVLPVGAVAPSAERSAPQTRHLVAAEPTRVPQVGHSRGAEEGGLVLFIGGDYT